MPDGEETAYEKNTRDQYAALGRFVEEFEMMVGETRAICIERLSQGGQSPGQKRLLDIPFHHSVMTAQAIFEIMRAIVAEIVNLPTSSHYKERDTFNTVLSMLAREYADLCKKRNQLLHGTWFIGYRSQDDPDAAEFVLQKYVTSADGLVRVDKLPKNAAELQHLAARCDAVRHWLCGVEACFKEGRKIMDLFKQDQGTWALTPGSGPYKIRLG